MVNNDQQDITVDLQMTQIHLDSLTKMIDGKVFSGLENFRHKAQELLECASLFVSSSELRL
jgi:hypothetical protein